MADHIRWGILGTGNIAKQFATGLQAVPDGDLVAVGSRSEASADAFGDKFDIARRHASYEALVADPDVDVIYVSTPHPFHAANSKLCIEAGKAVLCEKPFTVNAAECKDVIKLARSKGVFLMEAMWTRFFPIMAKVRQWVASGAIGQPRIVNADFGFRAGVNPTGRLFSKDLAGGALMDVGVYAVSFASMVYNRKPSQIASLATMGETGVDEQAGMVFQYDKGELAMLHTAIRTTTQMSAMIRGEDGAIEIPPMFWKPTKAILTAGGVTEVAEAALVGNGYNYQAAAVQEYLREGKTESDIISLDESLSIIETLDAVRAQWGLKYPME